MTEASRNDEPQQDEERRLTITEHLAELRSRLIIIVVAVALTTLASFAFAGYIFDILIRPAQGVQLIYIEMTEMLGTYIKVSLVSGVVTAMPVILYQLVMFVAPGLTRTEKRYLYLLLPGALLSFLAGATFAYFVLLPPALRFLLTFGADIATPQIKVGNYVSVVVNFIFWIGVAFETPLVIFFLARIGIVTAPFLAHYRRYAVVGAFILGAFITPTFDPVNQTLVALPIIALYEVGILLARLAQRRRSGFGPHR